MKQRSVILKYYLEIKFENQFVMLVDNFPRAKSNLDLLCKLFMLV